jgi:orotidine-5'-phosphate decarboxylase
MRNPIIAALDVPTAEQALKLAADIAPAVGAFKIGSELFTAAGPDIVHRVRATGASVFLDLKFHDIPNTVSKAVTSAVRLDVQMLTVHTSGGLDMLKAAEQAATAAAQAAGYARPLVLGVTVLTSLNAEALRAVGLNAGVEDQVRRLAEVAIQAGLRGLVCSPQEVVRLRQFIPADMQLITDLMKQVTVVAVIHAQAAMSEKSVVAAEAEGIVDDGR